MIILDFIFHSYYQIVCAMVPDSRRSTANLTTIIGLSLLIMVGFAKYFKNNLAGKYDPWILFIPPVFAFTILVMLYGSERKIKKLEEKRNNDSIVWPFLFAILTIVGIAYTAIY